MGVGDLPTTDVQFKRGFFHTPFSFLQHPAPVLCSPQEETAIVQAFVDLLNIPKVAVFDRCVACSNLFSAFVYVYVHNNSSQIGIALFPYFLFIIRLLSLVRTPLLSLLR